MSSGKHMTQSVREMRVPFEEDVRHHITEVEVSSCALLLSICQCVHRFRIALFSCPLSLFSLLQSWKRNGVVTVSNHSGVFQHKPGVQAVSILHVPFSSAKGLVSACVPGRRSGDEGAGWRSDRG